MAMFGSEFYPTQCSCINLARWWAGMHYILPSQLFALPCTWTYKFWVFPNFPKLLRRSGKKMCERYNNYIKLTFYKVTCSKNRRHRKDYAESAPNKKDFPMVCQCYSIFVSFIALSVMNVCPGQDDRNTGILILPKSVFIICFNRKSEQKWKHRNNNWTEQPALAEWNYVEFTCIRWADGEKVCAIFCFIFAVIPDLIVKIELV